MDRTCLWYPSQPCTVSPFIISWLFILLLLLLSRLVFHGGSLWCFASWSRFWIELLTSCPRNIHLRSRYYSNSVLQLIHSFPDHEEGVALLKPLQRVSSIRCFHTLHSILHIMVDVQENIIDSNLRDPLPKPSPNFPKIDLNLAGKWPMTINKTYTNN